MRQLTLEQIDDIIGIYLFRQSLPEHCWAYFDWWVGEVSRGTFPKWVLRFSDEGRTQVLD